MRQVADRLHLLQNLRATIARQLGGFEAPVRESATGIEAGQDMLEQPTVERSERHSETAERERLRRHRRAARLAMSSKIRALHDSGSTVGEIARQRGPGPGRIYRRVRGIDVPERSAMAPKPGTPACFWAFQARSRAEGTIKVRHLFSDIRHRGGTRSFSHLARFLAPWRNTGPLQDEADGLAVDEEVRAALPLHVIDPMTGRRISPLVAHRLFRSGEAE